MEPNFAAALAVLMGIEPTLFRLTTERLYHLGYSTVEVFGVGWYRTTKLGLGVPWFFLRFAVWPPKPGFIRLNYHARLDSAVEVG